MSVHDAMQVLPAFLARLPLRHLDLGNCRHLNLDVIPAMTQLEVLSLSVSLLLDMLKDQKNIVRLSVLESLWLCLCSPEVHCCVKEICMCTFINAIW